MESWHEEPSGDSGNLRWGLVPEPRLQDGQAYRAIGFFLHLLQNGPVRPLARQLRSVLRTPMRIPILGFALFACSMTLSADTPMMLRRAQTPGCYCHCAEAKRNGGCVKMCDSKRHASRWWATTCQKPHMQTPDHHSSAGPRFPHPGRAEHAQLLN